MNYTRTLSLFLLISLPHLYAMEHQEPVELPRNPSIENLQETIDAQGAELHQEQVQVPEQQGVRPNLDEQIEKVTNILKLHDENERDIKPSIQSYVRGLTIPFTALSSLISFKITRQLLKPENDYILPSIAAIGTLFGSYFGLRSLFSSLCSRSSFKRCISPQYAKNNTLLDRELGTIQQEIRGNIHPHILFQAANRQDNSRSRQFLLNCIKPYDDPR